MRALTLLLLLVSATSSVARAQTPPTAEVDAGVPAPVPCTSSEACARSRGNGWVCEDAVCQPYQDDTDLFVAVGLSEPSEAPPEAFKPFLTVLPVVGSNPTQGVLAGVAVIMGIYLGDPKT